jgi:SAM-dependent methyltransferase
MRSGACPLCASPRVGPLFRKRQTDYWACRDCAFRFSTPHRNANLANALDEYEEAYLQYLAPDPSDATNFESLCRWMSRAVPLDGKPLLDVGAGSGKFVRYLRGRGVEAYGLEPSRALFDRFLSGEAPFFCGSIEAGHPLGAFPIVTAFDVIEHVPDPCAFLRGIASALEPGGVFFLSTPDVESLMARLFGRRWHFYYPYHLSYFGPGTFARAASAHGLRLAECRHRGRRRSVGYMIRYAAEFIGGVEAPRWASWFEDWHLRVNLFDTMYAACRRDAT